MSIREFKLLNASFTDSQLRIHPLFSDATLLFRLLVPGADWSGLAPVFLKNPGTALPVRCLCPCSAPDLGHREMMQKIDQRFDQIEETVIPSAARGAKTVSSASAGGRTRAEQYIPKYQAARDFMIEYHSKNPAVSFNQTRKKAAQHLYLSESTLKNHVKKGDFADW